MSSDYKVSTLHLEVLRFVGQRFVLTARSSPPLPQPSVGVVGRRRAFGRLGGGRLVASGPLRADDDHGAPVVLTLVLRWLQHNHTLRVLLAQSVQRNHCRTESKYRSQI